MKGGMNYIMCGVVKAPQSGRRPMAVVEHGGGMDLQYIKQANMLSKNLFRVPVFGYLVTN